ncbi:MAG: hypothetical protein DCE86_01740 [Flavobacteriaceae bacterium]|uniref:hypothetical protein n=1 Tax=Flavobacterium sp. Leaf359 TaxID=1736351 RepID=UPI0006F2A0F2|nr:hypothetical protein [Flavobacterium sp. Leaf359]KQS46443.1 hypothetical protein ASG38_11605 [Flavobacterium sp. Leaf359]PZO34500.1 MAG: hypothetical protein DCE86_01740 [Flavobacteriaceae bacterium]PZQ92480.1 MAG: hypothetical protein DI548_00850 [Flavobacterium johnsoniae]
MQLIKTIYFCVLPLFFTNAHCQEIKKVEYLFLSRPCDTLYFGIAKDSSRASFFVYTGGYHIKTKRDSLINAQLKKRTEFPNIISSSEPENSISVAFWATTKKNVPTIKNLPYLTLEEFYKHPLKYYIYNRMFFLIPRKNGTFDIWESGMIGQE